jgi:DNA-directed RNA polymerase specialized sigma24 family protein
VLNNILYSDAIIKYYDHLLLYATKLNYGNREKGEDILQDLYVYALSNDKMLLSTTARGFVNKCLFNIFARKLKINRDRILLINDNELEVILNERHYIHPDTTKNEEVYEQLSLAMTRLKPHTRNIIEHRMKYDGVMEAGRNSGKNAEAFKQDLLRARKILIQCYDNIRKT